ncbi:MAG: Nif3-like dinuclear metal center hexameric protein [Gemmatimonadota bacterium]
MAIESEQVFAFLDDLLETDGFPDYPGAHNGLQVEGPTHLERLAVAVDASLEVIQESVRLGAGLLLVHHGLFWGGAAPLTGTRFQKVAALVNGRLALYGSHLPLDAHAEVGNSAVLARHLDLSDLTPFGRHGEKYVGWAGVRPGTLGDLQKDLAREVDGPVMNVGAGPATVARVCVVTGSGSSFLDEAVAAGADTLITGEAPHHAAIAAREAGLNLLLAGHYATETFGVKALAHRLEEEFQLPWDFVHRPTGL